MRLFFYIMRDSKRAMRSIETVRGTVSVPGCVPPSAEARRANLAVSAKKTVQDNLYCFYFFADYISNCQIHLTTNHFSALKSFSNKYESYYNYSTIVRQILIDYILYYGIERRRTNALSKIIGACCKREQHHS